MKVLQTRTRQSENQNMAGYKNTTTEYECNGQVWRISLDVDRFNNWSDRNLYRLTNDGNWESITRLEHKVFYDNFDNSYRELIVLMQVFSKHTPPYKKEVQK